jgi:hypothetical protein
VTDFALFTASSTLNSEHPTLKMVLTGRLMLKHKLNAAGDRSSKFDVERSMFNVK